MFTMQRSLSRLSVSRWTSREPSQNLFLNRNWKSFTNRNGSSLISDEPNLPFGRDQPHNVNKDVPFVDQVRNIIKQNKQQEEFRYRQNEINLKRLAVQQFPIIKTSIEEKIIHHSHIGKMCFLYTAPLGIQYDQMQCEMYTQIVCQMLQQCDDFKGFCFQVSFDKREIFVSWWTLVKN